MREYELTVVYDLAVQEAGGPAASEERLKQLVESRGGKLLKLDHWGRRRMAYPIRHAIDADYIVSRIEAEPSAVSGIETALRIDEKVYRHLIVRADELPAPPPPREPREPRAEAAPAPAAAPSPAPAPAAEAAPAPEATAPVAESSDTPAAADEPAGESAES
ncbi:30S ribosomal protein S6 [Tepidiforma flava]|uniref:Small ribosomal subunit protein bS6 n=1 Tax=Tepidiforma flava TaxID=3004094 RepID=A0ABY7M4W7_9CHLR|nr:30S ribosomal protein S6 [Tepidiforma flava]WBL34826.1 30S ribosomal protein S6 [Tepidiforma flava]